MLSPFICIKAPFICRKQITIFPSVSKNIPFVVTDKKNGFTLIELMVTLAVAGILAIVAVPAMSTFIQSNRLTATTNDFLGALSLARSEAIKRGISAGLCKSDNGSTCTPAASWEDGWLVFLDGDNNGPWTASDSVIRIYESMPSGITLTVVTGSDAILYNGQGFVSQASPNAYEYRLCSPKIDKARTVNINSVGRTNFSEESCP